MCGWSWEHTLRTTAPDRKLEAQNHLRAITEVNQDVCSLRAGTKTDSALHQAPGPEAVM